MGAVAAATVIRPTRYWIALLLLLSLSLTPHRKWLAWEVAWCRLFNIWCEIFQTTLIFEGGRKSVPKNFVLLVHPHGVIPIVGMLIWGATKEHGFHPEFFGGSGAAL